MVLMILVSAGQGSCRMSTADILGSVGNTDVEMDDQGFGISARLQTVTMTRHGGC